AKTGSFTRPLSDTVPISDVVATIISKTISLSDTVPISDSVTKAPTKRLSDTVPISDVVATTGSFTRPLSDTVPISGVVARTGSFTKSLSDTVPISDVLATTISRTISLSDTVAINDGTVNARVTGKSLSDTVPISGVVARTGSFIRDFTEQINIVDSGSYTDGGETTMVMGVGGIGIIPTSSTTLMTLRLSNTAGTGIAIPISVTTPTSNGGVISFLGNIMDITLTGASCAGGCAIAFTFTDTDLAAAGISNPADVVIYRDSEEDGTFVALATTLIDGAPSPYTVSATTFSTSFFGAGRASAAPSSGPSPGPSSGSGGASSGGHRTGVGPAGEAAGLGGILEPVKPVISPTDLDPPKIFDVKFQLGNSTKILSSDTTSEYVNYQSISVYSIVDSPTPLKRAELRFIKIGQQFNESSSIVMDIEPLQISNTTYIVSGTIPHRLMEGPAIVYWIHVLNEGIKVQDSDKYTIGVKPDYPVNGNVDLDIKLYRAAGTTATPIAYFTNEAGKPVYGTISLTIDGKTVYTSPAQLFDVGETGVKLEWKTPTVKQVTTYQIKAKAEFYGKSFETETTINTFQATITASLLQPHTIEIITDKDGNTMATPSILYASFKDEGNMRYRVIAPDGTCVIGGSEECYVTQSTTGLQGHFKSITVGDQIYRVRYSGPDNPLERFSITSI
ncbi:MAG: hypothetical protein ACRD32_04445, partial [Nitrososphaerales archaeon]